MPHAESWQAGIGRRLRAAAETRKIPGVVAVAANAAGVIYQGAFGRSRLPDGPNAP